MPLLVLSSSGVRAALEYGACADAMRSVLAARARGEIFQPLRSVLRPGGASGFIGLMPSYQAGQAYGLKALCLTPGNPAMGLDIHQGIVLLSDPETGVPMAVLNASAVTEIRTAAVSAVATLVLSRPDAEILAIVGTGVQARSHLQAITSTRPIAQVRVAGRTPAKAAAFAAEAMPAADASAPIIACGSVEEALAGADIVVTATSSAEPVLRREWLAPGAHINAVGACLPNTRELDTATVADAALFADSRESVLAESGDYLLAAADGAIGPDHIRAELGDLLAEQPAGLPSPGSNPGSNPGTGRRSADEITVFESLGLAVEDLAAGIAAYRTARDRGIGAWIDFD